MTGAGQPALSPARVASTSVGSAAAGTKSDQSDAMVLQVDDRVPTVRAILAGEASSSNYDFALMRLWL